jgi:2-dehydro-3-deoxygalactonokinase
MQNNYFISVDWGTTNLRIRLVKTPTLEIVEEVTSDKGIKAVHQEWLSDGGSRESFYLDFLDRLMNQFTTQIEPSTAIVLSGMASSNIGLRELPYRALPLDLEEIDLNMVHIDSNLTHPIYLISGLRSETDVVRGEETQLIGLYDKRHDDSNVAFVLPGTHSKHISCTKGVITDCKTFMTGELFDILMNHSILKNSIRESKDVKHHWQAFEEGVKKAQSNNSILNSLFKIRTNSLFNEKNDFENYDYLSGLLIGEEIKTLMTNSCDKIILCAGQKLSELYSRSIDILGLTSKTKVVNKEIVDLAVVKGQYMLLQQYLHKNKTNEV